MPKIPDRPRTALHELSTQAGLGTALLDGVSLTGDDPILPLAYRVAAPGAAAIAACAAMAARLLKFRTGVSQEIHVDVRAAMAALRSSRYLCIDGLHRKDGTHPVTGFYQLKDKRWIYLHSNFFNIRARNLSVLRCDPSPDSIARAVSLWNGEALEDAINAAGGCACMVRSEAEWSAHPQKPAAASTPLVEIVKIGEAPAEPLPAGGRPLSGVRVLDLTRVLAGPTCGKTLAEHGADVLRVNREDLASSGGSDFDTGLGKLATFLDFRDRGQAYKLRQLIAQGDIFSQAYRPGALQSHGLAPQDLAEIRPGIVYVSLNAWSTAGPWRDRRGYDTIVQSANGMAWRGQDAKPAFLPVSAQDYISGYLMAFGAMVALERRSTVGGSWLVRVSLARTGQWIRDQGLMEPGEWRDVPAEFPPSELSTFLMESDSPVGRLRHLAPVAQMSLTQGHWCRPAVPLGSHPAQWPPRQ
ncbi:CoA transferase [Candidimonas nitroreducens]|nr:CoA transferase [Candidimonas nitroreducens]